MFNWMTVILLVIVETITDFNGNGGFLEMITEAMVSNMLGATPQSTGNGTMGNKTGERLASLRTAFGVRSVGGVQKPPDFLKVLTKPFTSMIVKLDKKVKVKKFRNLF